jgi:hypothetical protein
MKKIWFSTIFYLLLIGCSQASAPPTAANSLPVKTPAEVKSPVVSANNLISAQGIGMAKLGMKLGKLKKILGAKTEFQVKSPFIVDFDAVAVVQNNQVQFYILYPAGTKLADTAIIEVLKTDNPRYQTAQGVGAGTLLKDAAAVYGEATLSYNLDNEGREYVNFANQPADRMAFRLGSYGDQSLAGIYPSQSTQGSLYETKQYKEGAKIIAIEINCFPGNCPRQ